MHQRDDRLNLTMHQEQSAPCHPINTYSETNTSVAT